LWRHRKNLLDKTKTALYNRGGFFIGVKIMGGQHGIGGTYHEPILILTPDYHVTGNPDPNANGNYFFYDTYNGQPSYKRIDGLFFIWWNDDPAAWIISINRPEIASNSWDRFGLENIEGEYDPGINVSGIPIVTKN
jgi:hypothetical protein